MSEIPFTSTSRQRMGARRRAPFSAGPVKRPRRAPRVLAIVMIALGALALTDAAVTLLWQEPFTALYAKFRQDHLSGTLRAMERAAPTPVERRALASLPDERSRVAFLARHLEHHTRNGDALGRILIPRIGASYVIVKGTGTGELESGPGVYSQTSFPGVPGTTAIAGHRTTYLAPFRHIDSLRAGNRILLYMPYAHFTYTVTGHAVVAPTDVGAAIDQVGYSRLVLSACTPLFSAAKRLLVFARLTRTVPVGAARLVPGGGAVRPIESLPPRTHSRRERSSPTMLKTLKPNIASALV